jgi:putative ABC transport system permease protein
MSPRGLKVIATLFLKASSLHRKRAILTVAAIAWGTVAIVMLLCFGEGLKLQMMRGRAGTGNNIAVWFPGSTSKVWEGLPTGRPIQPRLDDLEYLDAKMPEARLVGEIRSDMTSLSWGKSTVTGQVIGASWLYGEVRHHFPTAGGRFLNPTDERLKRRVIFLGNKMAERIFGDHDPVGETLMVNRIGYLVVGVMQKKMQMGMYGGPDDDHAIIPITTFAAQWGRQRLTNIVIQVERVDQMPEAKYGFAQALSARYRFDPTDEEVIDMWDIAEMAVTMDKVMLGFQIFLGIVGGLTLLIGGIGVANIMFAVVKEKTREIGVQMAIGARRGWITAPFVLQGLVYTVLGGLFGVVISMIFIILIGLVPVEGNMALEFLGKPTMSWQIALATAAVLGIIGTLAGYFPARRAASIDPAETLRYE